MTGATTYEVPDLVADGLRLRPWTPDDAPAVLGMANDPVTRTWSPSLRRVHDLGGAAAWIAGRAGPGRMDWAVCDAGTGELVARTGLHSIGAYGPAAEIGYSVLPGHRRRGIASTAVASALRHAFGPLRLARVSLIHAVGNGPSCAVATRCGFSYEGTERAALDHGDGELHDVHRHARLAIDPPGCGEVARQPLAPAELSGQGLLLRPWVPTDAPDVLRGLSDPDVSRWNLRRPLGSLDDARWWLLAREQRWRDGTAASWAVVEDGEVAGSAALRGLGSPDAFGIAAYWTMPGRRGRGVATRALQVVTSYGFEVLDLHRVELAHAVANVASCRVARKAGFRLEGVLRESNRLAPGFSDEHLHARLATDLAAPA